MTDLFTIKHFGMIKYFILSILLLFTNFAEAQEASAKIFVPADKDYYHIRVQFVDTIINYRLNPTTMGQPNFITIPLYNDQLIVVTINRNEYELFIHTYLIKSSEFILYPCIPCKQSHIYINEK